MINYLTVTEIAYLLKVHRRTIYLWIEQGVLKTTKFENDKTIYIVKSEVKDLVKNPSLLQEYTFTVKEICDFLNLKDRKWFVKSYINTKILQAEKVAGKYLVAGEELERFLNKIYRGYD